MNKIKALILDAGGVMVHPIHGSWFIPAAYREYLGVYAAEIGSDRWNEAVAEEAEILREDRFVDSIEEEYVAREAFLRAVAARMGWTLSEDALLALAHDFTYTHSRYAWYADTDAVLGRLHEGYTIGVLSDALPSFRIVAEAHDAPLGHFDSMTLSCEVGITKPDPAMYRDIMSKLDLKPQDCLFVDDKPCNLEGALSVGMRAVQMRREDIPAWDGPQVRTLEELETYLEENG